MKSPLLPYQLRAMLVLASINVLVLGLIVCALHASQRRRAAQYDARAIAALARVLPAPDLALTGGARWLRAPSLEDPAAAQADGIAFPDPEPGGGVLTAPRRAWAEHVRAYEGLR